MKSMRLAALKAAGLDIVSRTGCAAFSKSRSSAKESISEAPFNKTPDGKPVKIYTPRHRNGTEARINEDNRQLKYVHGYDDNWVLNHSPGMQFYAGNFLNGSFKGKGGWVYQFRDAFAMEPQEFPDAPNHPNFPSAELKPGQTHRNTIFTNLPPGDSY